MLFEIKRIIRLYQRKIKDWREKKLQLMSLSKAKDFDLPYHFELSQPIMPSPFFENKLHNIQLCATILNGIKVEPNQIFSFWHLIKFPSQANGFQKGRMLKNGKLHSETGGGICQVACILYHSAILLGLTIIERYCHSIDIYEEYERFTPLGADSTVVYGFKDLRFQNPYPFPIIINLEINNNSLVCRIFSANLLNVKSLSFDREYLENQIVVRTNELINDNQTVCIVESVYGKKTI